MPKKINFTDQQEFEIIDLYANGMQVSHISKKFNVSDRTIQRLLDYCGKWQPDRKRTRQQMRYRDSNYFTNINSWDKAYWLGFIAADGCVRVDNYGRYCLMISLSLRDCDHLNLFLSHLKSDYKIHYYELPSTVNDATNKMVNLSINDKDLVEGLFKLGITPKKSLTLKWPKFPKKFIKAFMLGYFDGDGCWTCGSKNKYNSFKFNLIGSYDFVEKFQEILCDKVGVTYTKIRSAARAFCFEYTNKQAILIGDWFYKNHKFCLNRKMMRYQSLKSSYNNRKVR